MTMHIGSGSALPCGCAAILWLAAISTAFSLANTAPAAIPRATPGAVMRIDGAGKEMQPYRVKVNGKEYNLSLIHI